MGVEVKLGEGWSLEGGERKSRSELADGIGIDAEPLYSGPGVRK